MAEPSRILILDGPDHSAQLVQDVVQAKPTLAGNCSEALSLVQHDHFAGLLIGLREPNLSEQLERFAQAQQIIEILPTDITIICGEFRIIC